MSVPAVSWLPICSSAALDMNLLCFTLIKKLVQLILENFQRTFAGLGFVSSEGALYVILPYDYQATF